MLNNRDPVLVATDLSARSDRAVDRAAFLASRWGVRLIVLHVIEPGSQLEAQPELSERTIRAVLPDPAGDVEILPAMGSAPSVIAQAAATAHCSLIVTGVARFNHVGDFLAGTAVDHIVRHATAPVLVVKQRCREPYRTILVATDLSSCSRAALLTAAELFPDATIHLVHAYHVAYEGWLRSEDGKLAAADEAQKELDAFLRDPVIPEDVRTRTSARIGYGETTGVVSKTALEAGADLVVIGTHGRSGFVQATIGTIAAALLRSVQPDTLMVRETT